jgi:hypothetical protein
MGAYSVPVLINVTNLIILILREIFQIIAKSLIFRGFMGDPNNLWITLLKTTLGPCARLEKQAFCWFAHQLSKNKILNKNKDLGYIGFHTAEIFFYKKTSKQHVVFCA